eukprot:m.159317 g.159317  ORF g.159317 m.159317 type:complete len:190 (-) comp13368_c0_seq3:6085-6654(-)
MLTAKHKIKADKKNAPSALDEQVATALYELQVNSDKLKELLREVQICSAKEVDITASKKAILIFVPVPQLSLYQRMIKEKSLVDELEKKFSGKKVVILAQRRIIAKEVRNRRLHSQKRPRNRSLTAVHESILEDVCFPNEIVGKRIRYRPDGSRLIKVFLNKQNGSDELEVFQKVYKHLTGKDVEYFRG